MKKTAILLTLCIAALVGCGKVDSVDTNGNIKPFEIGKTTTSADAEKENIIPRPDTTRDPAVTTAADGASDPSVTTAVKTGAVNLVKRSGAVTPQRTTPARVTAKPSNNTPRPKQTTRVSTAQTTAATAVTTTAVTTVAVDIHDPSITVKDDLACAVKDKSIEIIRDGVPVQTIEIDTKDLSQAIADGNKDAAARIVICDFDFDGHDDIFIPQEIGENNTLGVFMHYDAEKKEFTEWKEMETIGGYAMANAEEKTINIKTVKNELEYQLKVFRWDEDKLAPVSLIWQYRRSDSEEDMWNVYTDYYDYPEGVQTITKREKLLFNDVYEVVGCEEIEITWSMS